MKTLTKKLLSLLLALTLLFAAVTAVNAAQTEDELERQYENGYEFSVMQTEDGPMLTEVYYVGRDEGQYGAAFLPETLGGLPVTPDVINGLTFIYGYGCDAVKISADNPYFKTVNGALYSKDGKTLVFMPNRDDEPFAVVPDGVEIIGEDSLWYFGCAILPDSVVEIRNEHGGLSYCVIAADTGTVAEAFALANGVKFVPLDAEHSHIWFRGNVLTEATCTECGTAELVCPCGAAMQAEFGPYAHQFRWSYDEETGGYTTYCRYCGKSIEEIYGEEIEPFDPDAPSTADCPCVCHKFVDSVPDSLTGGTVLHLLRDFFYRLRIVLWRVTGTHQYCECGERHY